MKNMKKLFVVLLFCCSFFASASAQRRTIAIPEVVDRSECVSSSAKSILRTALSNAVASKPGFAAYDRVDIDTLLDEHMFQQTGLVSEETMKQLGQMTGAQMIMIAEVDLVGQNLLVTAKVVDIETGQILAMKDQIMYNHVMGYKQGCTALANNLLKTIR